MSNWSKLKRKIQSSEPSHGKKTKEQQQNVKLMNGGDTSVSSTYEAKEEATRKYKLRRLEERMKNDLVALDCEMVGIGPNGKVSALARCSLVDYDGNVLYDEFVQPKGYVTDFRTKWSGVRKSDINRSHAVTIEQVSNHAAHHVIFRQLLMAYGTSIQSLDYKVSKGRC